VRLEGYITYFKRKPKCEFDLSKIPPSISHATIKAVVVIPERGDGGGLSNSGETSLTKSKRGVYIKVSGEEKAVIGKYAHDHGVAAAIRHFKGVYRSSSNIPYRWFSSCKMSLGWFLKAAFGSRH